MSCVWKSLATRSLPILVLLAAGCNSQEGQDTGKTPSDGQSPAGAAAEPSAGTTAAQPDSMHPVVVIETSLGDITVKLNAERAEMTAENFLRYVDEGHYTNTIFHEVHKDHVIIGGAYTPEKVEKETAGAIFNEARDGLKNLRGTIAMARKPDVIDSATCHFFINLQDHPNLDHRDPDVPEEYGYCVFGDVIEGMDVVERIASVEVHDTSDFEQTPVETVLIKSIRRVP